ncbi:hypothetical protein BJF89_13650 [Corynebacterium sp. CNJ-954]|uniref:hypothetical protein n=1 Tax=Corynebacterium sp. CNJ-954 TaxID=1904962 RepID=UPI00096584EA|nr:hypothetical protein [Corynebacterium sp. CNJ-954]OLT55826.1 hypothetical protein BJF89_13650 [Corynebacterium sp. CNJ-954]
MSRRITTATLAAITTLTLAACGASDETADSATQAPATSTTAEEEDNGPVVDRITGALDKLDAPWGNVEYKGENEEAVATDVWDLDINERDSSILVFLDEDARKEWEQSVIWLDGISVAYDNVGISLNSGLGKNDSLELAPKLAEELDGRVTTGDTDMFRDDADEESEPDESPNPPPQQSLRLRQPPPPPAPSTPYTKREQRSTVTAQAASLPRASTSSGPPTGPDDKPRRNPTPQPSRMQTVARALPTYADTDMTLTVTPIRLPANCSSSG